MDELRNAAPPPEIIVPLKCECGNRDDTSLLAPPCSNDCGRRMVLDTGVQVYVEGENAEATRKVIAGSHIVRTAYSSLDDIGVLVFVRDKSTGIGAGQIQALLQCLDDTKQFIFHKVFGSGEG